jgi:hypothetical protein
LVSIEEDVTSKTQHILNKICQALAEPGEKPYSHVEEIKAIFIVAMRKQKGTYTLVGNISPAEVMVNVLSALADCKIISQDFGKAVLHAWMKAHEPPKE